MYLHLVKQRLLLNSFLLQVKRMLICRCSFFVISIGISFVLCKTEKITTKYHEDPNSMIKLLHGSTHAKIFLNGCVGNPYVRLVGRNDTKIHSEVFQNHELELSTEFNLIESDNYLFAIYSLQKVSLLISKGFNSGEIIFNLTLGINKNKMAKLEVLQNNSIIANVSTTNVPILPTIPFYIRVSTNDTGISVYEARARTKEPFLSMNGQFNQTLKLKNQYSVKFQHSSSIFAYYDCCETCEPWIYNRLSGCSKYSARTANIKSETMHTLTTNSNQNITQSQILFNQTILINHDNGTSFGTKIIFSENESFQGKRYEIVLSRTPTIFHFSTFLNSTPSKNPNIIGANLELSYTTPFIVNIAITSANFALTKTPYLQTSGVVTLRRPYEDQPFLEYRGRMNLTFLRPTNVKYMMMVKLHEDFIRYDIYHQCSDIMAFTERHPPSTFNERNESFPRIIEYHSMQFNTTKFDVVHVFQDSFNVYEKFKARVIEESSDYDEIELLVNVTTTAPSSTVTKDANAYSFDFLKKGLAGAGSFLFIGFMKIIFSLDFIKNLMKEVDVDDDKAKELRQSVGKVFNRNISQSLGVGED